MKRTKTVFAISVVAVIVAAGGAVLYTMEAAKDEGFRDPDAVIGRTSDLEEVKTLLAEYENASTFIETVDYIAVQYAITDCRLSGEGCGTEQSSAAELEIFLDFRGFPEKGIFHCKGFTYRFSLGDPEVLDKIKNCH